ncbi:unnamed protein product [Dovyalis caffra]|uniref:UV radiation resistance-associated gene protein n=1 Tax=Dovyalis caffra TaxID=77055 RepID=A0AAV1R3E0_9ROSI|nr:unnamed protein product [Dovyalis caffra]
MEPERTLSPEPSTSKTKPIKSEEVKIIEWEDYEHEGARLWSLSSALNESKQKKQILEQKLHSLIQVEEEALNRVNELEEMKERVWARKSVIEKMRVQSKVVEENAKKEEERLSSEVRSLLVAGTALSAAKMKPFLRNETCDWSLINAIRFAMYGTCTLASVQAFVLSLSKSDAPKMQFRGYGLVIQDESRRSLAGERGYLCFAKLQKKLRLRQQYMVAQVSLLYPIKISAGPSEEQELESFPSSSRSGNYAGSKPVNQASLTILGLHLSMLPFTKMSLFTDKKEVQRSASALGYVAHAVSLIASYLKVPLRYPLRLGGSHSYIIDSAPSIDPTSSDLLSSTSPNANMKPVEFPLFLEGQDTTRAAYAVFLLNKDLEQLLNYVGVRSLGPRHVLANLKELTRTIQSAEFLDT